MEGGGRKEGGGFGTRGLGWWESLDLDWWGRSGEGVLDGWLRGCGVGME